MQRCMVSKQGDRDLKIGYKSALYSHRAVFQLDRRAQGLKFWKGIIHEAGLALNLMKLLAYSENAFQNEREDRKLTKQDP